MRFELHKISKILDLTETFVHKLSNIPIFPIITISPSSPSKVAASLKESKICSIVYQLAYPDKTSHPHRRGI